MKTKRKQAKNTEKVKIKPDNQQKEEELGEMNPKIYITMSQSNGKMAKKSEGCVVWVW